jgi:hypothetical protein
MMFLSIDVCGWWLDKNENGLTQTNASAHATSIFSQAVALS